MIDQFISFCKLSKIKVCIPKVRSPLEMASDSEETELFCNMCDKHLSNTDPLWGLPINVPLHCQSYAFCLCEPCYLGETKMEEPNPEQTMENVADWGDCGNALLYIDPVMYVQTVRRIGHCGLLHGQAHTSLHAMMAKEMGWDAQTDKCKCRCGVCNRCQRHRGKLFDDGRDSNQSFDERKATNREAEQEWFVALAFAFNAEYRFLMCPECADNPAFSSHTLVRAHRVANSDFSKKWLRDHLKRCTLNTATLDERTGYFVMSAFVDCEPACP